jgi:hypothetical protein
MKNHSYIDNKPFSILCLVILFLCGAAPVQASFEGMQQRYQALQADLTDNFYDLPIYIESKIEKDAQHGDIYGIITHPFQTIESVLSSPSNWCDVVSQHLNIKACTYQHLNNHCQLTFYSGRKFYEPPEDAYKLDYTYSVTREQADYFHAQLVSEDGPLGTSNYRIIVEAMPLDETSSFIHFAYHYQQGLLARIAMGTYLATLGRDKRGFTITGQDRDNKPIYIDGTRGVIERNVIRYYFAIQSYLDNLELAQEKQYMARISSWFDLTERYPQLYEMDKRDYLEYKQAERKNQLRLQHELDISPASCDEIIPARQH